MIAEMSASGVGLNSMIPRETSTRNGLPDSALKTAHASWTRLRKISWNFFSSHKKFISASAGNNVLAAEAAVKNISDTSQGKITCRMSPRIVDFFKMIQISADKIGTLMFAFAAKILDLFSETS